MSMISLSTLEHCTLGSLENRSLYKYDLHKERYKMGKTLQLSFVVLPLKVSTVPGA